MIVSNLSPATGPLLLAAFVLAVAGVAKLRRPAPTGLALARLGLPQSDAVVRTLGVVEVVVAIGAAGVGGAAAGAMVALYLGFTAVTAIQVRRSHTTGETSDCGCFGATGAPVDASHVAIDLLLAAGALWATVVPTGGLSDGADAPGQLLIVVALAGVGAVGVRALLTDLSVVRALVRLDGGR